MYNSNNYVASLQCMPVNLCVQGKIAKAAVLSKSTILVQHQVFEVVTNRSLEARKSAALVENVVGNAREM